MNDKIKTLVCAVLSLSVLGIFINGCDDTSNDIPTSWDSISYLMSVGWNEYNNGDFVSAYNTFLDANQRNAFYLPAYNGLGWSAVRLTNFNVATLQFSFIQTSAVPGEDDDLLADAYAGLCLSSTIARSVLEISGDGSVEELDALAQASIDYADSVFAIMGEDYAPMGHDPDFGAHSLHLLKAQNYFYLLDFANSEAELIIVDPGFVSGQVEDYGVSVEDETVELELQIDGEDSSWVLTPAMAGIHDLVSISCAESGWQYTSSVNFGVNEITLTAVEGTTFEEGVEFTISYVYIDDLPQYLFELIDHIQSLINI